MPAVGTTPTEGDGQARGLELLEILGNDETCLTFKLHNEDHTMGNALRYVLMKRKDVEFCGYSIPHPSDNFVNIRVQTLYGVPATEVFRQALRDLKEMSDHIRSTFEDACEVHGSQAME